MGIDRLICGHLLYQKNFLNYLAKKFEKIKKKKKHKKCHFLGIFLVSKLPTLHTSVPILVANQPSDLWPSFIQKAFLKIFSKKNQKNQKIQKNTLKMPFFSLTHQLYTLACQIW